MNNLFHPIPRPLGPAHHAPLHQGQPPEGDAPGTGEAMVMPLAIHELAVIAGGWGQIDPI